MGRIKDLTGATFNYLTVLELAKVKDRAYWKCICKCGNTTVVAGNDLIRGTTKSCGCRKRETKNVKHGMRYTRLYRIWWGICKRCYNSNCKEFKNYGGRGIFMCDEWKNDFRNFYQWAQQSGYDDTLCIDRIDNDGNYSPENCRWTTPKQQANNRRNTVYFEHDDVSHSLTEWAKIKGINRDTAYSRYWRMMKKGETPTFEDIFG